MATAAAPEGPASLARWHALGAAAAERIGVEQVVVPVGDRHDAQDPANAMLVTGAGLIYLSGGDPAYLTETLRDTPVWQAILGAWRGGAALAGCSAGAMAMSASLPDVRRPWRPAIPGLGLVPSVEVLPHFDRFTAWMPDLAVRRIAGAPPGVHVVGIDEETALVGGLPADGGWTGEPAGPGATWRVLGRRSVWLLGPGRRVEVPAGGGIALPVTARG
ncbi:MAG TPA: Type 1 glutamine amidotransferase-like domain-containing protein [Kineosporiaceae bacterium]|nr:Type 1 glutamine amidotransferase-like domain-containing protein [Kineosporiaceae bacterium]